MVSDTQARSMDSSTWPQGLPIAKQFRQSSWSINRVNYAILSRILDRSNNRKETPTVEPTATPWEESHLAPETDNTSLNSFIANMTSAYTETVSSPMLTESNSVKRGRHESYVNFLYQGQKLKEKLQGSDFSHVLRVPTDIILSP